MKQSVPDSEKYAVAWFKLAELVSRREKERALALYRLLEHSLEDKPFASQLEADILLAFNDATAFEKYAHACRQYAQAGKMVAAACVYEHMITLEKTDAASLRLLVDVYNELKTQERVLQGLRYLMRWLLNNKDFQALSIIFARFDELQLAAACVDIRQELVHMWISDQYQVTAWLFDQVKRIIEHYFITQDTKSLQSFLMTLKMIDVGLYEQATVYMQSDVTRSDAR